MQLEVRPVVADTQLAVANDEVILRRKCRGRRRAGPYDAAVGIEADQPCVWATETGIQKADEGDLPFAVMPFQDADVVRCVGTCAVVRNRRVLPGKGRPGDVAADPDVQVLDRRVLVEPGRVHTQVRRRLLQARADLVPSLPRKNASGARHSTPPCRAHGDGSRRVSRSRARLQPCAP